ncbi:hypothetical protein M406DRAFT_265134 [Cryphonectria parasitica EP155]|uniref:Transfer RNA methyltransferase 82 n=1 Tax=Cryphonectria parasitica (strain ATCC 38755 / EP155) TaxID=660469 RepID=A0A9P4XWQ5_CRYP1|nr:uncharacterized protein M406DRAFT_265134 [Cryphonectria parasitica EP155]KAF3762418.1 hypothetical protein M406DRAFT_265134 [Cryphonectria parasitica EP155]
MVKFPFHGVQVGDGVLFATRAGNIHSFNIADGSHISCWKYPVDPKEQKSKLVIDVSETSTPTLSQDDQGPPAKRVKLDGGDAVAEVTGGNGSSAGVPPSSEALGEDTPKKGKKNKKNLARPGPLTQPSDRPMVILMTSAKDGSYLVAVTSDKSVWVFEHDGQGELKQLSRRRMPKRPCSIVLTPDNKDILAADKFGDVYSVPLIPSEQPPQPTTEGASPAASSPPPPTRNAYTPQASELTVHTKRNRQALLDQVISKTNPKAHRGTPRRVDESFERHLLLGHVSLLTAVTLGFDAQGRRYIITADRDEHIRVSRGTREQAHVIEAFCLGHEEFVNRLCVPEGMGDLLVSGGGDPDLFVWRWRDGAALARADLLGAVKNTTPEATKVAVTALCSWRPSPTEAWTRVVVICERVPVLFIYTLQSSASLEFSAAVRLPGNPLDVGVVSGKELVVTVDRDQKDANQDALEKSILGVKYTDGEYVVSDDLIKELPDLGAEDQDISSEELQSLLYSAETLRKLETGDAEKEAGGYGE